MVAAKVKGKQQNNEFIAQYSVEERMALTIQEIISELVVAHKQQKDVNLNRLKCTGSSKYGLSSQPKLVDIIAAVPAEYKECLLPKLKAKPVRTASGIAVVAVMCKPHRCPHINFTGNICVYCPGGPDSDFELELAYVGRERTVADYTQAMEQLSRRPHGDDSLVDGYKSECPLNKIAFWHVVRNKYFDPLHDWLHGVAAIELNQVVSTAVSAKMFTLEDLNSLIMSVSRGPNDSASRPVPISESTLLSSTQVQHVKKPLKQNAAQMYCLIRHFCMFLTMLSFDLSSPLFEFSQQIAVLTDMICAPRWTFDSIARFRALYRDHLCLYNFLFPTVGLIPKHHFMLHYPEMVLHLGPPSLLWTFAAERFGQFVKSAVNVTRNRRNLPLTLARRYSLKFQREVLSGAVFNMTQQLEMRQSVHTADLPEMFRSPTEQTIVFHKLFVNGGVHICKRTVCVISFSSPSVQFGMFIACRFIDNHLFALIRRMHTLYYDDFSRGYHVAEADNVDCIELSKVYDLTPLDVLPHHDHYIVFMKYSL